jgi:Integrase core domain/Protein kinase domain
MTISPGTRLGPFDVVDLLGAGGMGAVYRAHDPRLRRDVAIKVLPAGFLGDPNRLRRFEQEALAVARLAHPNIVAIHDIGTHEGSPYIVTELLEGGTLREKMRFRTLPVRNGVAERFVRTVRSECLDWLLVLNRAHLHQVLRVFVDHYNGYRPHRALRLRPPKPAWPAVAEWSGGQVQRRDRLGGVIHEYGVAA